MRLTVSQLRRIIKEEVAMAMGSPEQHTEDCVYGADDTFVCASCGEEVCWCQGAADDMSDVCTGCWEKSQNMPAVREGKLTLLQLRNIIREALVGGADRRMSGGGIETAMSAGRAQTPQSQEMELLKRDIAAQKAQIKKVKAGKMRGQDLVAMEDHLAELESKLAAMKASPVKESVRNVVRKPTRRLSEGFDVNAVVDRAYDEFYAEASAAVDEDDPTMNAQVDAAAEDFRNEVEVALESAVDADPHRTVASVKNSVMRKLLNGEYV